MKKKRMLEELRDFDFDWERCFERCEAMQNCYVPHRLYRFGLMLRLAGLPRRKRARVLDLGCGPGSLSFFVLRRYPNALILAVDLEPVLLAIGEHMARKWGIDRVQFMRADIRDGEWWSGYNDAFDLIVSAPALHWLNAENLSRIFQRSYKALKPGGWFINSDHAASNDPQTQDFYREALEKKRRTAFRITKADDWNGFWQDLEREFGQLDLAALRNEAKFWEGTEDGCPRELHTAMLRECGFERAEVYWQGFGEVVMGARKPIVQSREGKHDG